jgi:hypothetical protein
VKTTGARPTARRGVWPACFALAACAAAALGAGLPGLSCVRHADLRDEPDSSLVRPPPTVDSGDVTEVDSGLGGEAFPQCGARPTGKCVGSNDFLCGFDNWLPDVAAACQQQTGCKTNGWLSVKMSEEGCITWMAMDQPNDEVVACLVAEFGSVRCPCPALEGEYFFGEGNVGVCEK